MQFQCAVGRWGEEAHAGAALGHPEKVKRRKFRDDEAVSDLCEMAEERISQLACMYPGEYFAFDDRSQQIVAKIAKLAMIWERGKMSAFARKLLRLSENPIIRACCGTSNTILSSRRTQRHDE